MGINKEASHPTKEHLQSPSTYVIFFRHGEPEKYGSKDAALAPRATEQIRESFHRLLRSLNIELEDVCFVVRTSKRPRTQATAKIIQELLADEKKVQNDASEIKALEILCTAEELNALVQQGIPGNKAFSVWKSLSETELLHQYKSRPPRQLGERLLKFARRSVFMLVPTKKELLTPHTQPKKKDTIYLYVTHETSIHAAMLELFPEYSSQELDKVMYDYSSFLVLVAIPGTRTVEFYEIDGASQLPLGIQQQMKSRHKV